jgi:hypothetical protein
MVLARMIRFRQCGSCFNVAQRQRRDKVTISEAKSHSMRLTYRVSSGFPAEYYKQADG